MDVSTALAEATLVANDYIKSQTTAATFYDGFGFYPSFDMTATSGYMLKVENSGSFNYPAGTGLSSTFNNMLIEEEDLYYKKYEFNGSISASVHIEDVTINKGDILYAYANGELRGKTSPSIFPLTDKFVFTLMVYGDGLENEKIHFELYNQELNKTYKIKERIQFEKDMIIGDAYNTFELKEGEYSTPKTAKLSGAYPNPFNPVTNITYSLTEGQNVKLSVYDIMGREVQVLENGFKDNGEHSVDWNASGFASGIYYIQITAGGVADNQKVMLIK